NNPRDVINPPEIRITGRRVNISQNATVGTTGTGAQKSKIATYTLPNKHRSIQSASWKNQNNPPMTFSGKITMEIVPHDSKIHRSNDYRAEQNIRKDRVGAFNSPTNGAVVVGKRNEGKFRSTDVDPNNAQSLEFGKNTNTYYSVNGKTPTKSQAHLYKGPVILHSNATGTNKTVIKAKTYWKGGIKGVSEVVGEIYIIPSSRKVGKEEVFPGTRKANREVF
ncbi:hypothetical protein LCGC14_2105980, partial [marine sediment metagenome]